MRNHKLTHGEMLMLKRWNTPTIYNGWERFTQGDIAHECFNLEETIDFMPQMGPMAGRAVTVMIEPSDKKHKEENPQAWSQYRKYIASIPGPKIVIVQDLDSPQVLGSFWGEVNSSIHTALGCVGTITDGGIRDLDEMTGAGFKALARRLCVGHAHVVPVRWGEPVEVFGCRIIPGQLVHADKHGFLAVPSEDERRLLEAALFMDSLENQTLIQAARDTTGLSVDAILDRLDEANNSFSQSIQERFGRQGE